MCGLERYRNRLLYNREMRSSIYSNCMFHEDIDWMKGGIVDGR